MDIQIVPTEGRYRRRRSNFGRFLAQLTFFLASLIPMCIIAWRIDLLSLGGQQPATEQVAQPAPEKPAETPRVIVRERPQPRRVTVPVEPASLDVDEGIQRQPLKIRSVEAAKPEPTIALTLDIEKRRQRDAIEGENLRLALLTSCPSQYKILPADGSLPATVTIADRVTVRVSTMKHGVEIEATIKTDAGKDVPFTIDNMRRAKRRVEKEGQRATATLARLQAERSELQTFIDAPVLKALAARGQARTRVMQIDKMIPGVQEQIAALSAQFAVTDSLLELATQLHGQCEMHFRKIEE